MPTRREAAGTCVMTDIRPSDHMPRGDICRISPPGETAATRVPSKGMRDQDIHELSLHRNNTAPAG